MTCYCCCCNNYKWIVEQGYSNFLTNPDNYHPDGCEYCQYMYMWRQLYEKKCAVKTHGNKADETVEYAFTLTMPPTYQPKKPIEEVARLICTNGLTNKPYEKPEKWAYVIEHTEAGTAHIHGMYKTPSGRRIATKYFNRYWPLWDEKVKLGNGHQGGYHSKARHNESYSAYMTKEGCVHSSEKISLV